MPHIDPPDGAPPSQVPDSIFDQVDKDADGKMTEAEFTAWAGHNKQQATEFLAFLDETDFGAQSASVSFEDKLAVFWLKAVMEFDDNVVWSHFVLSSRECVMYNDIIYICV